MFGSKRTLIALSLIAALGVAACGDEIAPEVHADAEGVELVLNGVVIASYDFATMVWTGEMNVDVGTETAHISVNFIDHDGNTISYDPAEFYLEVDVDDVTIAEFEQDMPGDFGGHLHGHMVGETDVAFMLMHGAIGSGHADLTTEHVHAHVN